MVENSLKNRIRKQQNMADNMLLIAAELRDNVTGEVSLRVQRFETPPRSSAHSFILNTLRTGDANLRFLRFCITTVKDK
jgi:hypothetical protein